MFAIVEVAGQQFKVEKSQNIFVHRLQEEEGKKIVIDRVLLVEDNGKSFVGMPVVEGYQVKATILTHLKGDKVKVFKKKRRKGYQVLNGHRQFLTEIRIDSIERGKPGTKKATDKEKSAAEKTAKVEKAPVVIKKADKPTTAKAETKEKKEGKKVVTTKPKVTKKTTPKATGDKTKAKAKAKTTTTKTTKAKAKTTANKTVTRKMADKKSAEGKKEDK